MLSLSTPVETLKMVGSVYGTRLKKLGITTVGDLLYHIPSRYEDFSLVSKINMLQAGETVSVITTVQSFKNIYTKNGKKIQKAIVADETGQIEVIWYNQPFLSKVLLPGMRIILAGKVAFFLHSLVFQSPDYEIVKPGNNIIHSARLVPIYPETEGVSSKWLRSRIASILFKFSVAIEEILPASIRQNHHLPGRHESIFKVHFPKSPAEAMAAKRRLAFDELILLQLASNMRKKERETIQATHQLKILSYRSDIEKFIKSLSFRLTLSQEKATREILLDLEKTSSMNRLLEGEVGSGKTVVAAVAMYASYLNGFRSILMAPTEILAKQHYQNLRKLFESTNVNIGLWTGSLKRKPKAQILIGTHALLYKKLPFNDVALTVIDEQQRFGVEQRSNLLKIAGSPHVLTMTATPIPRTIALTLYCDLDLSILDQMPVGRQKVKTWVVPNEKRGKAYLWIKQQLKEKGIKKQAFIVCPFIEESESMETIKAVKKEFEALKEKIFPDLRLGLLHGKMKAQEKEKVMDSFKKGKIDLLVTTPVVEVGIDIPNAAIILIEGADRFGLAQLHQLRGRVGRGNIQSYCLLFTDSQDEKTRKRLKYLEVTFDGPKLAELDLKLRGPGDIFGIRQHGQMTDLKIADNFDITLVEESKIAAAEILNHDPDLSHTPYLQKEVKKYTIRGNSN